MPSKFQLFLTLLWAKIKGAAKWLVGGLAALAVLVIALIGLNSDDTKKETTNTRPEIAQVYEPSISTPLPPDNNSTESDPNATRPEANTGQVAGATTTESFNSNSAATSTAPQVFVAPKSGINDYEPIKYENTVLGIKTTLPAGTQVIEKNSSITFYSKSGSLLYTLDVIDTKDTLEKILEQLQTSTNISKISKTNFANNPALQFSINKNALNGYIISKNNKAYYFIGNNKYLVNISI